MENYTRESDATVDYRSYRIRAMTRITILAPAFCPEQMIECTRRGTDEEGKARLEWNTDKIRELSDDRLYNLLTLTVKKAEAYRDFRTYGAVATATIPTTWMSTVSST
jgi:hypothetical protein